MQVEPGPHRIVDRAEQLPIEMRPDPETAQIGVSRRGKPVAEIIMIARGNQRVGPGKAIGHCYRGHPLPQRVQGDCAVQPPGAKTEADIGILVRQCQRPVQENRAAGIDREIRGAAAEQDVARGDARFQRRMDISR